MTPGDQVLFCRLINYFHHGDYGTFRRICEMVHPRAKSDRYFVANYFLSSHLSGFIEISDSVRSTWWWSSFDKDIEISGLRSKSIGTTKTWLEDKSSYAESLITDSHGYALLFGHRNLNSNNRDGIFGSKFFDKFPRFMEAELDVLVPETYRSELGKHIEVYNLGESRWISHDHGPLSSGNLVRVRKEFSGLTYYIVKPDLGLLFRLLHPEWAFICALNLLNWKITSLFKVENQNLILPRSIRLPAPIFRYLFASSENCRVGSAIEFLKVDEFGLNRLHHYLNPNGSEHESKFN